MNPYTPYPYNNVVSPPTNNKSKFFIFGFLVLIVIGIIIYFISSNSTSITKSPPSTQPPISETSSPSCKVSTPCVGASSFSYCYPFSDTLLPGQKLLQCQALKSADGSHLLSIQSDGNLVLYNTTVNTYPQNSPFATNTAVGEIGKGIAPYNLFYQNDGNIVLYDSVSAVIWASNTVNKASTKLVLQNDGNLILYNGNIVIWGTNTNGK